MRMLPTDYVATAMSNAVVLRPGESAAAERVLDETDAWVGAIIHFAYETLNVYRRHQTLFVALAETSSYDREAKEALDSLNLRYARQLLKAIEPGQHAGFVRPDIDEELALALVWTCERISYRLARRDDEQLVHAAGIIAKILWRTLYTGAETPSGR